MVELGAFTGVRGTPARRRLERDRPPAQRAGILTRGKTRKRRTIHFWALSWLATTCASVAIVIPSKFTSYHFPFTILLSYYHTTSPICRQAKIPAAVTLFYPAPLAADKPLSRGDLRRFNELGVGHCPWPEPDCLTQRHGGTKGRAYRNQFLTL